MKLFQMVLRAIYLHTSVQQKVDKNGREFVSFKIHPDAYNDKWDMRQNPNWFIKSVVMYERKDGGALLLINHGGKKNGKPFHASTTLTIKMVAPELFILIRKGKKQGFVWQEQVNFLRREARLPIQDNLAIQHSLEEAY